MPSPEVLFLPERIGCLARPLLHFTFVLCITVHEAEAPVGSRLMAGPGVGYRHQRRPGRPALKSETLLVSGRP